MSNRAFRDKRIPLYTIIGGCMYDTVPDLGTALRRWTRRYTGENYAYFRLYESNIDGRTYRSTIYTKMPLCIFQFEDEAVAIGFSPVVAGEIPSASVWLDDDGCHFEYTSDVSHTLKAKTSPHLGDWESSSRYRPDIEELPELVVSRASKWQQLVREFVGHQLDQWQVELSDRQVHETVRLAEAFHNRLYDSVNGVHLETAYPDRPERYSDAIFNHPSFEACRVAALVHCNRSNQERCDRIVRRLVFDDTLSSELRELGPYRVWQNSFTTLRGGSDLYGCTTFGTGYSGYPGGMATFLRKLLEYTHMSGIQDVLPRLRQGVEWLLYAQREDGSFPFTIPSLLELGNLNDDVVTGPESQSCAGAAEAARAFTWAFRVFQDERYLSAAEKAVEFLNPVPPVYAFRGFSDLRDASAYESDATSGIELAKANLDLYDVTGKPEYLNAATMLGYYVLTWHYWWCTERLDHYGFIDPMAESFSPHVSPWNTLRASELYSRLFQATSDSLWKLLGEFAFTRAASLQSRTTGGISEAYNIKWLDEITSMGAESGMCTWAALDAGLAILRNRRQHDSAASAALEGKSVDGVTITAGAEFILPPKSRESLKQHLRLLKRFAKRLIKDCLGAKGVARLQRRDVRVLPPMSYAPQSGRRLFVSFGPSDSVAHGLSFTAEAGSCEIRTRLAALAHDNRIRSVFCPIITFDRAVVAAEPLERVGEIITSCRIRLEDGSWIIIQFLDGTSGLGVDAISAEGKTVRCDVTLKAGWQFGGECRQVFRLMSLEEQD